MQNEEYRIKLKKGNERSLALIKSGMDIVVAIGLLQLAPKKVTPRVTGAFGFVTSLISCYQVFASSNLEFYLPYFSIAPEVSDVTHNCTERVSLIMISPSLLDFSLCIFFPLCYIVICIWKRVCVTPKHPFGSSGLCLGLLDDQSLSR